MVDAQADKLHLTHVARFVPGRQKCACLHPAPLPTSLQTLLNDCKDLDPTIRGLAVRSMCSLRVPELMENVVGGGDPGGAVQSMAGLLANFCLLLYPSARIQCAHAWPGP